MITNEILATYRQLRGQLGDLDRARGPWDDPAFAQSLDDLGRLVQQAVMVTRGLTDEAFAERVRRDVDGATASSDIAAEVWELAAAEALGRRQLS